jgi:hypothetical protein
MVAGANVAAAVGKAPAATTVKLPAATVATCAGNAGLKTKMD